MLWEEEPGPCVWRAPWRQREACKSLTLLLPQPWTKGLDGTGKHKGLWSQQTGDRLPSVHQQGALANNGLSRPQPP